MEQSKNTDNSTTKKARKVWRTVNVSTGGEPPQSMTPEAAAKYIQQAAVSRGREVKISFGPNRPPGQTAATSVSFGNLDLAALAKADDLSASKATASVKATKKKAGKDGLPCSEAEMKALMSMFVEIMGMSMDTDKLGKATASKKKNGPVFMFGNGSPPPPGGWPPGTLFPGDAAAAAAWELVEPYRHQPDDDDDDSLPDLDDMRELQRKPEPTAAGAKEATATGHRTATTSFKSKATPAKQETTGKNGIAPIEWESLEQVAIDDAIEADERAKKAAKKREKKQRKKEKARKEAAQKAVEAAQKKREKAVLSWRSRVVSACQSNEVSKLEVLLSESPLKKQQIQSQQENNENEGETTQSSVAQHLEFLLPNSFAKNRQQLDKGKEARQKLADFILTTSLPVVFSPLRSGRAALHTACFNGDVNFVQQVVDRAMENRSILPELCLDTCCRESGWSPLHYSLFAGSDIIMESLLKGGCDVSTLSDDTQTWSARDGKGLTARQLAEIVLAEKQDILLETHGTALSEATNHFLSNPSDRRRFQTLLKRMIQRLSDVELNGYSCTQGGALVEEKPEEGVASSTSIEENSKQRKKRKKRNKQKQTGEAGSSQSVSSSASANSNPTREPQEDPLVTALLGMGFTEDQIQAAAKACGGTTRATADDLVAWIFSDEAGEKPKEESPPQLAVKTQQEDAVSRQTQKHDAAAAEHVQKLEQEVRKEEEARANAKRLAAKREETRRRNREWNSREQARQREEAQAKLAHAVELRARADAQRAACTNLVPQGFVSTTSTSAAPSTSYPPATTYPGVPTPVLPTAKLPGRASAATDSAARKSSTANGRSNPTKHRAEEPKIILKPPPTSWRAPTDTATSTLDAVVQDSGGRLPAVDKGPADTGKKPVVEKIEEPVACDPSQPSFPPGFQPAAVPGLNRASAPATDPPVLSTETNALGEIRATAKAFVPTNFTPAVTSGPAMSLNPSPGFFPSNTSNPTTSMQVPPFPRHVTTGSGVLPGLEFPSREVGSAPTTGPGSGGLLTGAMAAASVSSMLSAPPVPPPGSFDRLPSATPSSEQSELPPSAASSVTGISAVEEPQMPTTIGFGRESQAGNGSSFGGSSMLSSSVTSTIGGTSIWGDALGSQSQNTFSGFSSLLGGGSSNRGEGSGVLGLESGERSGLGRNIGSEWGSATATGSGGGGSIW